MVEFGYRRVCYAHDNRTVDKTWPMYKQPHLASSCYLGLGPKMDQIQPTVAHALVTWMQSCGWGGFLWGHSCHSAGVCGSDESGKCGRVPWHHWDHFTTMAIWQVSLRRPLDKAYWMFFGLDDLIALHIKNQCIVFEYNMHRYIYMPKCTQILFDIYCT